MNSFRIFLYNDHFIVTPAQVQWQFSYPGVVEWAPSFVYWGKSHAYLCVLKENTSLFSMFNFKWKYTGTWGGGGFEKGRRSALSILPSLTPFKKMPAAN